MKVAKSTDSHAIIDISDVFEKRVLMPSGATLDKANEFIRAVESMQITAMANITEAYERIFDEPLTEDATELLSIEDHPST